MTQSYCVNCWFSPLRKNAKNCPSCGYPDNEGEKMTLEQLIESYESGDMDFYNEVRVRNLIEKLIDFYDKESAKK